ncbi:sensor histidine kinase [Imhoffiella purpurea]|uniref:histidine kinase n=1 Tax=Imhoffiella purpurea TaxID=1249627 RepID=W9V903_9GAMM|nr:ATP-binding protein [Imhoffiella purpurea]EXJ13316.1 putative hybrid sensor and regulator protein [Imhoffiella purpurea]
MKIAYKLLIPLVMILILGFGLLYAIWIHSERAMIDAFEEQSGRVIMDQLMQDRQRRFEIERGYLEFVASMAAKVAVEFVSNMNYEGIEQPISELLVLDGVKAVHVFDATTDQTFVAAYREGGRSLVGTELPQGLADYQQFRHRLTGHFDARDVDYGYIAIYYDDARLLGEIDAMEHVSLGRIEQIKTDVQHMLARRISFQLLVFAAAALLLAGGVFLLVYRFVLVPLRALHLGLDGFFAFLQRQEDRIEPIALGGGDEFGDMARALNKNIEVSAELLQSINALNATLEQKVEARTRQLRLANEKLELSLEGGRLGSFDWDIPRDRYSIDVGWADMLGFDLGEMGPGLDAWKSLVHPEDIALVNARFGRYLAGEVPHYESQYRVRTKDGGYLWILARGKIVARDPDGRPVRVAGTHMDITHIKETEQRLLDATQRAESALAELQSTQAQLIQSEKMAALGHLIAGVAHEINTPLGAVKSSGTNIAHSLEQALGNLPDLFGLLTQEEASLFLDLLARARAQTGILPSREARRLTRGLTEELEGEGVTGARRIADILVQLGVRDSLAPYLPLIRHPRSDFILDTAYSIAAIATNAANINHAVERAAKIITALKSFSRLDAGGKRSETDLRQNIETVLTLYHNQIKQSTELVCRYAEVPPLPCYPDELCQVWTNLVHNALQAMDSRGTLRIALEAENGAAVVTVADTGGGIAPEIRERIFEPFFTTKRAGEGSGLGLDIVRKIVAKHGGHIEMESEVGVGTTFKVYLPYPEPR